MQVFYYDKKKDSVKRSELKNSYPGPAWIRVVDPTPAKILLLSEKTKIPLEELQEALEEEERPKVATRSYLEVIYRAPYIIDNELETLPIYFYIYSNKIITIEKKPMKIFEDFSLNMSDGKHKSLFKKGMPYFLFLILDQINDEFLTKIDRIAAKLDIYENFSRKNLNDTDIEKIYENSVTLSFFNQALIADVEVLNSLKKGYSKLISSKDKILFEELYYNILQIIDTEKIQRESITQLINVHAIITNNRLNDYMKRLTAIALIVAIPALISSFYGMNFDYIPLAEHRYGFYIFSVAMVVICVGFYYLFKRFKWV
jgi:magnesium transporter